MPLNDMVQNVATTQVRRELLRALRNRRREFDTPTMMHTLAVVKSRDARQQLEQDMRKLWGRWSLGSCLVTRDFEEVVIGGGLHAAIYCANRVAMGYPRPLVIEKADRLGGSFACSDGPAFYLNSRNRPGPLDLPGEGGGLNVMPGCPIQPSLLSQAEYQSNDDLALAIRMAFVDNAKVVLNAEVTGLCLGLEPDQILVEAKTSNDVTPTTKVSFAVRRVIDARGLGAPRATESDNVLGFAKFMKMQDDDYPLRGLKRVAVVGGGDSSKTAVESLLGIGPSSHLSVPELDFVECIDWYGRVLPRTCEAWKEQVRGRYRAIGSYLPQIDEPVRGRLNVIRDVVIPMQGMNCAYINERPYDLVILCTGARRRNIEGDFGEYLSTNGSYVTPDDDDEELPMAFGRRATRGSVWQIGPAADLPYSQAEGELPYARIAENLAAIFRLAGRTAALASVLDGNRITAPRKINRSKAFSAA